MATTKLKLRKRIEGLGLPATVETGGLPKETAMKITGNATIDKCGSNEAAIGRLTVPAKDDDGTGTVETRFKEHFEIEADGALTAGQWWKYGALNGDGHQTAKTWVDGTDSMKLAMGVVWVGAADDGTAEVLTF